MVIPTKFSNKPVTNIIRIYSYLLNIAKRFHKPVIRGNMGKKGENMNLISGITAKIFHIYVFIINGAAGIKMKQRKTEI